MKTFTDNAGRDWQVCVNVDTFRRVRSVLDVNLMGAVQGDLLEELSTDPILLCNVLYVVCREQADERDVSDEDFGRAMGGDAIESATVALLEELVDFFPSRRRRVLARALAKLRTVEERAIEYAEARLDSPELDRRIEAELKRLTEKSLNLPESRE